MFTLRRQHLSGEVWVTWSAAALCSPTAVCAAEPCSGRSAGPRRRCVSSQAGGWRCGRADGTARRILGRLRGRQGGNLEGSGQETPHPAEEDREWRAMHTQQCFYLWSILSRFFFLWFFSCIGQRKWNKITEPPKSSTYSPKAKTTPPSLLKLLLCTHPVNISQHSFQVKLSI